MPEIPLFHDMPAVVAITNPARFRKPQDTLVNLCWLLWQILIGKYSDSVVAETAPNLAANTSSACWASAADNWFFATSRRCAHSAASSAELRPSISRSNSTHKLAERAVESSDWSEAEPDLLVRPPRRGRRSGAVC